MSEITKQRTGRTTRLIHDAIQHMQMGHRVYVIVANSRERRRIEEISERVLSEQVLSRWERNRLVLLKTLFVAVETVACPHLDWSTMTIRGDRGAVVLVDHYAIESHFHKVFAICVKHDVEMPGAGWGTLT